MNRIIFYSAVIVLFFSSCAISQNDENYARGVVFHDENGNGLLDENESGIEGVAVSNGIDVVLTDKDGMYCIPTSDDNIIFVVKPGNFEYTVNEFNLPQFYYNHKKDGSPPLNYEGVAPTGDLPEMINFGLLTGSASDKFSIVVFADPQPYKLEEISYYERSVVDELAALEGFAFGVTIGDLVGDRPDFFEPLKMATARIGIPWFNVIGNHDLNFDAVEPMYSDESFERVFGPANYAFNHGKVHFIVLNNIIYPNTYTDYLYVGGFHEHQFQFIKNTLKYVPRDHLVVILAHIPLFDEYPFGETFLDEHRKRLFTLLKDRPFTFSMSGHTHAQQHYYFSGEDGWYGTVPHHHYNVGTVSGGWWSGELDENGIPDAVMRDGTPKGYNIIHFNGNDYTYDYKVTGASPDYKMRLYGPKVVPQNAQFWGEFFVNFFQGCEKSTVEYRLNEDEEWRMMRYVIEQDPYISSLRCRWDSSLMLPDVQRPPAPTLCYHLWKITTPSQLPEGPNTIHVRATDAFGREYFADYTYHIVVRERN